MWVNEISKTHPTHSCMYIDYTYIEYIGLLNILIDRCCGIFWSGTETDDYGSVPDQERTIIFINCLLLCFLVSIILSSILSFICLYTMDGRKDECAFLLFLFLSFLFFCLSSYDGWVKGGRFSLMVHQYSPLTKAINNTH